MTAVAELYRVDATASADGGPAAALEGVDLTVGAGEILGVAGEAGAAKTALALCLLGLLRPTAGIVRFEGADISRWPERRLRPLRSRMAMVFRDPAAVLNPYLRVRQLIEEPLLLHAPIGAAERRSAAETTAAGVGLRADELDRRPDGLAPERLQLVALARALAIRPRLLVLDEPDAALGVAGTADLLALLAELKAREGMAIVVMVRDIATVLPVADRLAVMLLGQIVEQGPAGEVAVDPLHPYTQALLAAHLPADPAQRGRRLRLRGEASDVEAGEPGCSFAPRCPIVEARCRAGRPTPNPVGEQRQVACVRVLEGTSRIRAAR